MTAPVCRCGHGAKEHAHGVGMCFAESCPPPKRWEECPCESFSIAPVVLPRGTSDRCERCGTTHALPSQDLPWCPVDGRKGAADAS